MIHELNLHPGPFASIKGGKKDIEMRLNEEKRKVIKVGDYIRFTNNENGETILCKVISLSAFPSFKELYDHFPKSRLGYGRCEKASYKDMEQYYSEEKIRKNGALAIEIALVKN